MMKWPTGLSRQKKLTSQADDINQITQDVRTTAQQFRQRIASQTTKLAEHISIFEYFVANLQNLERLSTDRDVLQIHATNLGLSLTFESETDVDTINDKFLAPNSQYRDGDRVTMPVVGLSTLPQPFSGNLPGTVYFVVGQDDAGFQLSETQGGLPVDITDTGLGSFNIEVRLNNAGDEVRTAMQAVIDQIDAGAPKDPSGWVLEYKLDPTGLAGDNGLSSREIAPGQTDPLQAALQAVEDSIESPA